MKRNIIVAYAFFISILTSNAYILESNKIETILEHIDGPDTLVVLDLDNTLIHPQHELGSDEWFSYLITEKLQEGFSIDDACVAILPYYYYAHHYLTMKATEPVIPELLKNLINQGINVIALTARSPFISEITHEQLKQLDIHFSLHFSHVQDYVIPFHFPCLYRYNMLFVSNNDKGEALRYLLEVINYHPKKIVYVDDKMKYLHSIEKVFGDRTEVCCIRYSGCDDLVANFDPAKAQEQLESLQLRNRKKDHCTENN